MLRWDWNKKIGVLNYTDYDGKEVEISIYKGNALMIFIYELPENRYQLFSFFADKEHLNNLLKESDYFSKWNKITLWEVDNDTFRAVQKLYKVGVHITLTEKKGV